jgi:hypothetical protein
MVPRKFFSFPMFSLILEKFDAGLDLSPIGRHRFLEGCAVRASQDGRVVSTPDEGCLVGQIACCDEGDNQHDHRSCLGQIHDRRLSHAEDERRRIGSCGDGRPRPSKPSEARQLLHRRQLIFRHHDPGRLAGPWFLADHDLDIAIQRIEKMQQALNGKTL